jgi:hypothetical protein
MKCENRLCPGRAIQYGSNPPTTKKPHNHDVDEKVMQLIGIKEH